MSLNWGGVVGSGVLLSVLLVLREERTVGAVGMWKSRQRFPGAVGREGNLFLVFPAFHPPVISTALRGVAADHGRQALCFVIPAISLCLACCIARAASVSVCALAKSSRPVMLTPDRRQLSHPGV